MLTSLYRECCDSAWYRIPTEKLLYIIIITVVVVVGKTGSTERRSAHYVKGKRKAVPLQAWSGPEVSRKLRFPDFMTTAQDGGKVVNLTHRPPLPPGNTPSTHIC